MLNNGGEKRWQKGLKQELKNIDKESLTERIAYQKIIWLRLLDIIKNDVSFDNSKYILDIGCERTSIFLSLRVGKKYALDPLFDQIFSSNPLLANLSEYQDVHFISSSLENVNLKQHFDIVFLIMVLNHMSELEEVVEKIDRLLSSSGKLVIIVECYADPWVRKIMNYFDIFAYHPHNFIVSDVVKLFPHYKLKKKQQIANIYSNINSFENGITEFKLYRLDKVIGRIWKFSDILGNRNFFFILKMTFCFALSYTIAALRKKEKPVWPLDKPWLFVFEKI